jgi:hypothetical protein
MCRYLDTFDYTYIYKTAGFLELKTGHFLTDLWNDYLYLSGQYRLKHTEKTGLYQNPGHEHRLLTVKFTVKAFLTFIMTKYIHGNKTEKIKLWSTNIYESTCINLKKIKEVGLE